MIIYFRFSLKIPFQKFGCDASRWLSFKVDTSSVHTLSFLSSLGLTQIFSNKSIFESSLLFLKMFHVKHLEFYICGMWFVLAILSSVFAALTSILAKVGIENVNSSLATAIRTFVVLGMSWGMVLLTHSETGIFEISKKSWLFLILSGLATGASWLCYYKALQIGEASKVVPIDKLSVVLTIILAFVFLHETVTLKSALGCVLIGIGTLLMVL